jgi:hypothetical protein
MAPLDREARQKTGMHQTTLRFGPELWSDLAVAAGRAGISIAQYVREATLERLARARATEDFEAGLAVAGEPDPQLERVQHLEDAHLQALSERESSKALWAQNRLTRARSRELRERAARLRRHD